MARAPLWFVVGLVILAFIVVLQGDAKITTSEKCDDFVAERAMEDVSTGFKPPIGANFWGLGIGFCILDYED